MVTYRKNLLFIILLIIIPGSFTNLNAQAVYNKIVFSRHLTINNWNIYLMDRTGTGELRLTNNSYRDTYPYFKPDGTKIAFARIFTQMPLLANIMTINPDGTGETNLTQAITYSCNSPHYSWDGTKICFDLMDTVKGNSDLYIMNADGSNITAVLTDNGDDSSPFFSPDGNWIVFQRLISHNPNPKVKISKVNISTAQVVDLTDGSDVDETPAWSPDGQYIVFKRGLTTTDLYKMSYNHDPANNADIVNLTNTPTWAAGTIYYSFEGDKLVYYTSASIPEACEIYTMDPDGSNKTRLTNNSYADWDPAFSPASPVPVQLISFTITTSTNKNLLQWTTATELNNYGYEIERKEEGKEWQKIGFVKGAGTTFTSHNYTYTDDFQSSCFKLYYRLHQLDNNGNGTYSGQVFILNGILPERNELIGNYPNPFNPSTNIKFSLNTNSLVTIKIFNIHSKEIATILNEQKYPGEYTLEFTADKYNIASGVYFYKLTAGSFTSVKKMVLLK